jgi:1,4-alpha-glucan branching enzyme
VYVPGQFNSWSTTTTPLGKELTNGVWDGVWSADVTSASPGQQYKYYINYSGGSVWKHDPRARCVTYSGSASGANDIIYDPTVFNWSGDSLVQPALNDLFLYELHMGTFPSTLSPSRFVAATNKLDYLKSLGINAVEIMPIAEFPGDNSWGYNPAQPFAVENIGYGGPDGFKTFVRACHARGLAVLLDVVHNHYGPSDLDLWNFDGWTGGGPVGGGIYFYQSNSNLQITPYGDTRPNFSRQPVRDFVQDNFALWLDEYHVDGFRWDTPGLMMNAQNYGYISDAGNLINAVNAMIHANYTGKITISEDVYNSFGFDSAWDTSYPGYVTLVLASATDAGRDMNVVANAVQFNVRYGGQAGSGRVAYLESHDVVGDLNGGVRLVTAIDPATPNSYRARKLSTLGAVVTLTAPGVPMIFQGQEMLENQSFDSGRVVDWSKTNTYNYIVRLYRDLISARRNLQGCTPGLEGNQCSMLAVDNVNKVVAFHRWKSAAPNQDAVVVAHFANNTLNNYVLNFPSAGNWYVQFNSDSTNYGPDYGNIGSSIMSAGGSPASAAITIGPYSALILSQTPNVSPTLTIAQTNDIATISWPNAYSGWVLDASTTLAGTPPLWNQVPGSQYQTNSTEIFIDVNLSGDATFYRLRKL